MPAETQTDLKRAIVGYVTCDYVDVLEARSGSLQVSRSFRVSDDREYNNVGSTGLTNQGL